MQQAFTDLEGTIPAQDGDRVALITDDSDHRFGSALYSPCAAHRPILNEEGIQFDYSEGQDGERMTQDAAL